MMLLYLTLNPCARLWHRIYNLIPQGTPCDNSVHLQIHFQAILDALFCARSPNFHKEMPSVFLCRIRACEPLVSCSQILLDTQFLFSWPVQALALRYSTSILMCLSGLPALVCKLLGIGLCLNLS